MKDWKVLPLSGKYYGTKVETEHGIIEVWLSDHFASPFGSVREIAQGWRPEDGHDHVEDENSYRAACLIAAAPELLEALVSAIPLIDTRSYACNGDKCRSRRCYSCFSDETVEDACRNAETALEKARAAIAKARGEA